jgi:hypothetical protein
MQHLKGRIGTDEHGGLRGNGAVGKISERRSAGNER